MIPTSNNIMIRNQFKRVDLFDGFLDAENISTFIDEKFQYVIMKLLVRTPNAVESIKTVGQSESFVLDRPYFYDPVNKTKVSEIFLCVAGVFYYIIDAGSFSLWKLYLNKNAASSDYADIRIDLMFTNSIDTEMYDSIGQQFSTYIYEGAVIANTFANTLTHSKKYLVLEYEVTAIHDNNAHQLPHFYFGSKNMSGETVYPRILDQYGNQISEGPLNAIYLRSIVRQRIFLEVGKVNITILGINVTSYSSTTLKFKVDYIGLTNDISGYLKEKQTSDEVLLPVIENDKFKFVKMFDCVDCFKDFFANFSGNYVYVSNEANINNPYRYKFDVTQLVPGSTVRKLWLIPYDDDMLEGYEKIAMTVLLSDGSFWNCSNVLFLSVIGYWAETKFWEKYGTARKIPVKNIGEVTETYYRFDPTLPSEYYLRNETKLVDGHTYIQYQGVTDMVSLGPIARTRKLSALAEYHDTGIRDSLWLTTNGGLDWVAAYDFIKDYNPAYNTTEINTDAFVDYVSGLTCSKITTTFPTTEAKEPETVFAFTPLSEITSITKGSSTIINMTAHGLVTGDMVMFTDGGANGDWGCLKNTGNDATNLGDNVYYAVNLTVNTFKIVEYVGSYDSTLKCRHIHSVNETKDGLLFACGEKHPNGWIMFLDQHLKDRSNSINAFRNWSVYRLNSSSAGLQRACGLIMDSSADPYIIFNCDDFTIPYKNMVIADRTSLPIISSGGVWKGKLSDIDDITQFECILPVPEPGIWMYKSANVVCIYFQLWGFAISTDGETFTYFNAYDVGNRTFNGEWKGRIVINGGYVFTWK